MRSVAFKIFLTFAVALAAFALAAGFGASRIHASGKDLRLLSEGYLPLTRIAAQIDVKDWVTSRVLEAGALDAQARRAWLPLARAHFPAVVREKVAEGREVAARAQALAGERDLRFLGEVASRLEGIDRRWAAPSSTPWSRASARRPGWSRGSRRCASSRRGSRWR